MLPPVTKPAKLATGVVVAALLVGLVYEIGFNADDAFWGLVVAGFLSCSAVLMAIIWVIDDIARKLIERRGGDFAKPS
jgi:hypothetical protein